MMPIADLANFRTNLVNTEWPYEVPQALSLFQCPLTTGSESKRKNKKWRKQDVLVVSGQGKAGWKEEVVG